MANPYLYKRYVVDIIYHIQTKLQTHLPDELKHDIYSNVLQAVETEISEREKWNGNWYDAYLKLKAKGHIVNWNEMKIRIAWEKDPIPPEVILKWMLMRENDSDIRRLIPSDEQILKEIVEG